MREPVAESSQMLVGVATAAIWDDSNIVSRRVREILSLAGVPPMYSVGEGGSVSVGSVGSL